MINPAELDVLRAALEKLDAGYSDLPPFTPGFDADAVGDVLEQVAVRMQDNFPYYHPLYAGQMLKPPHPVARIAYALSLWINPNNHALDGGRASSAMDAGGAPRNSRCMCRSSARGGSLPSWSTARVMPK